MNDAFRALANYAEKYPSQKSLWLVDENYDVMDAPDYIPCTNAMTNRVDIAKYLESLHVMNVDLSDYDFAEHARDSLDVIYLRVPKSKALLNHLIRSAVDCLKLNGRLILVGYNDEGIKTTFKHTEKALGILCAQKLLGKGLRIAKFQKTERFNKDAIDDRKYQTLKSIEHVDGFSLLSKAGIYGADKIDKGSVFLCETIRTYYDQLPNKVLDLGCGNGLIAVKLAHQYRNIEWIVTDNNVTAIEVCAQNLLNNNIHGEAVLADCGDTLDSRSFEMIVCNPPFHQGFETSEALTLKFLAAIARLLTKKGEAWLVMNKFLSIEKLIHQTHLSLELMGENQLFKVLKLKLQ